MNVNPFGPPKAGASRWLLDRSANESAVAVLVIGLLVGSAAVLWRAQARASAARSQAFTQAIAVSRAVELQFNKAVSAAEILSAVLKQSGDISTDFHRVAAELLYSRPGLSSIELAPGGVVSAIVPRTGNERAIGFNVFKEPIRRAGAEIALKKRTVTVAGPLTLYGGEPGIVVLAPIFRTGRDGRESVWGLVAVSMRVSEALARAHVSELGRSYNFSLRAPVPALRRTITLAESGRLEFDGAVEQAIQVGNLEWRLALAPPGAWASRPKMLLDGIAVFLVSALMALLTGTWIKRRELQALSDSLSRQLAADTQERHNALEKSRKANEDALAGQREVENARVSLAHAEGALAQVKAQLEELECGAQAESEGMRAKLQQTEARAGELEVRLNAVTRAARDAEVAHETELHRVRTELAQVQESFDQLRDDFQTAVNGEKTSKAAAQTRAKRDQEIIAGLESRLEAATRAAHESAVNSAAQVERVQNENAELRARLEEVEGTDAQLEEMARALEQARAELRRQTPAGREELEATRSALGESSLSPVDTAPVTATVQRDGVESESPNSDAAQNEFGPGRTSEDTEAPNPEKTEEKGVIPEGELTSPAVPEILAAENEGTAEVSLPRELELQFQDLPAPKPKEHKRTTQPRQPISVDVPELRKAVNQILPLLTDKDPGARDCLKANRATFRAAFSGETFAEFEQLVRTGAFAAALEQLRKAVKRHGITC